MDEDYDQRITLPLQLWTRIVPLLPGDVRRKALRLIRRGDRLSEQGKPEAARVMYSQALEILEQTGVHHLSKKVKKRLLKVEEVQ